MNFRMVLKGFVLAIAICMLNLLRPVSCRMTLSTSKYDSQQADQRVAFKCYRKCRQLQSIARNMLEVKESYEKDCWRQCIFRQIEKEAILSAIPRKKYIILGPNDKPAETIPMPPRIPHLPKELYKTIDERLRQRGDCGAYDMQKKVDANLKKAVSLNHIMITCGSMNEILVNWKQPNGLSNSTGYQVDYRLASQRGGSDEIYCFEVEKDKTSLLINNEKGFSGQKEIFLAVTALPLPLKYDIELQKFEICQEKSAAASHNSERIRRNIKPTPSYVILKEGDPLPTDLVMPSIIPDLPGLPDDPFAMYKQNSNCRRPPPNAKPSSYAGSVHVFQVTCKPAGNFSKKEFIVHWSMPEDYRNKDFTHFQLVYSIPPNNVIMNPKRLGCKELTKDRNSYPIPEVDSTDVLNVAVVPYPTYSKLEVRMQRFVPCLEQSTTKRPTSTEKPGGNVHMEVAVGISISVVVVLSILAGFFIYRRRKSNEVPFVIINQTRVYVSYYADSRRYHSSLLNLVAKLRRAYEVNLIMDSYCQTEVAELGLARWCQRQLSESARIVMVVSKEYLKICERWQNGSVDLHEVDDINVNRVCTELQYIINHIFERRKNSLLTIVLADVNHRDLPEPFRGMQTFQWPENENQERAIVCNVCEEEVITT